MVTAVKNGIRSIAAFVVPLVVDSLMVVSLVGDSLVAELLSFELITD